MSNISTTSQELLARAYALASDKETKELYHDWASTYDETMINALDYLTPIKTANLLASALGKNKSALILDVGSGTGLAGQNLAELNYISLDAIDYSSAMLDVARARENDGKKVYKNCIKADLNKTLKIKTHAYEAIICTGLFTHAHVGAGCLPELFRILKPHGYFATTVHKDIWYSEGFDEQVKNLERAGKIKTVAKVLDIFFETDKDPQGYYILWECLN